MNAERLRDDLAARPKVHINRNSDAEAIEAAARDIVQKTDAKPPRIMPPSQMTKPDTSVCHLLFDGDLDRIDNASKFGGASSTSTLIYGAALGILQPLGVAVWRLYNEGYGTVTGGEFFTLVIGLCLIGASGREILSGSKHERVGQVCAEIRGRQRHNMD